MRIPPLQEWRQDQAEQGEDQTLQGNEDIREKRRHHQGDEDEEAVAFEAGQLIVPRRRQETHEDREPSRGGKGIMLKMAKLTLYKTMR